jgi:hypothetical protein
MTDERSLSLVGDEVMTEGRRPDSQSEMIATSSFAALECRVGLGRVALATDAIDIVGEYEVGTRLPLTERISYSVGVWEDEVLLSMSLARIESGAKRATKGLVLVTPGASLRWAFEIVAPIGLVEIAALARPQSDATRWLRTATLARGGSIQFVDVRTLIADVAQVRKRLDG